MDKDTIKNSIAGLVAGVIASAGLVGIVELSRADIDIPEAIKGEQGDRGDRGARGVEGSQGSQGVAGKAGKDGKDGEDGKDGKLANINMDKLADDVADLLDDRDENAIVTFGGNGGDYALEFDIEDDGDYVFTLTHYGSDDFDVSLEDEDGFLYSLVDTEGHINIDKERELEEGTYILRVSADGEWAAEVHED